MLPMGTIMTCCMAIGIGTAAVAPRLSAERRGARLALLVAGVVVGLGGLWNTLWYAPRHLGELWGTMALGSGLLMLLAAAFVLVPRRLPPALHRLRPLALLALGGFMAVYAITIYSL